MNKIKIGIVDDSAFILKMLSRVFNSSVEPGFEVLFELDSCDQFSLFKLFPLAPEVVIMDVDMPGINGIDGIPLLLSRFPDCPIIMFTDAENTETMVSCITSGAMGYLKKKTSKEELMYAISVVLKDEFYISSRMVEQVFDYLLCEEMRFMSFLEPEQNILAGIQQGMDFICYEADDPEFDHRVVEAVDRFSKRLNDL